MQESKILPQVQLRAARIPGIIGYIAAHYWFVVINQQVVDRWEVWQNPDVRAESWGHLHKNLMPYDSGVGHGESWVEKEWQGKEANLLIEVLENSPHTYQYTHLYRYWPGPNSNTYAQWVLNQAQTNYKLGVLGIGRGYLGFSLLNLSQIII